jgi:hypothetical protein
LGIAEWLYEISLSRGAGILPIKYSSAKLLEFASSIIGGRAWSKAVVFSSDRLVGDRLTKLAIACPTKMHSIYRLRKYQESFDFAS